ncbi:MAG: hypothetical protein NTW87_31125, partial [Planctomycetota bacterium]|nr:hypothetical protein [Planctomycetota bacterium]
AATPALSDHLIRFPRRTAFILEPVTLREHGTAGPPWRPPSESVLQAPSHAAQLAALRHMRIGCMLQIAALDLMGLATLPGCARALSDLADMCIAQALAVAVERLRPRLGVVRAPPAAEGGDAQAGALPFVIFALGKLGGRELNYSSDIDLVFTYAGSGETEGGARPADFQTYFTALAEELSANLDQLTEDGRAYRVDLRLRPHGSSGQLVRDTAAMLDYFQSEGRTWERQAWLKARPVAGDLALGQAFLDNLAPFIFRRYFSMDAITDLKALKRQMELSVAQRGESDDEVKLGRGGIRDIEFVVQFLQLLHGGENPRARSRNTLEALYELRREGLLTDREAEPLSDAYVFLRNVEHRLQLQHDLQVHRLPSDPAARAAARHPPSGRAAARLRLHRPRFLRA